jgi:hypothetical protein
MTTRYRIGTPICGILLVLCASAIGQAREPADPMDYSKLGLRILKAYTVPQIVIKSSISGTITPKDGSQIVVIELQGTAPEAMALMLPGNDFAAKVGATGYPAQAIGRLKDDDEGQSQIGSVMTGTTVEGVSIN